MSIVVATASATVFVDSQRVHIIQGTAWASDSVVVALHPDMFTDDESRALGLDIVPPVSQPETEPEPEPETEPEPEPEPETEPEPAAPIEQKTAEPGEKANVKRRNG